MLLIVLTDGPAGFENARQLCCYKGITPEIRQSGTSIRGRSRISKVGNQKFAIYYLCVALLHVGPKHAAKYMSE